MSEQQQKNDHLGFNPDQIQSANLQMKQKDQSNKSSYPNLLSMAPGSIKTSSTYKAPMGQFIFNRQRRAMEIFGQSSDFFDPSTRLDTFEFGEDNFNIRDIYQHYYSKTNRYPIQAFLDIYFHDTLQDHARSYDEKQRLLIKTKKFSQLAQKLYNLRGIEEKLTLRIKILEYKQNLATKKESI